MSAETEQLAESLAARIDALQAALAALEKQVGRAGREQLKANAVAEGQAAQLAAALEQLRAAEARRDAERAAEAERQRAAVAEARLELARALFPVVDGLDEALRAGRESAARPRPEGPEALLRRLLLGAEPEPPAQGLALGPWLAGLEIVRRRLLDALASAGVTPMAAAGRPFDPRLHIAAELASGGAPPGHVAQEIRRGFIAGERVLRHAEVAVVAENPTEQL